MTTVTIHYAKDVIHTISEHEIRQKPWLNLRREIWEAPLSIDRTRRYHPEPFTIEIKDCPR